MTRLPKQEFNVKLQGQQVAEMVDVVKAAGGAGKPLVLTFPGVRVVDQLAVELVPSGSGKDPHQLPTGIDHVVVNGPPIIADGVAVENLSDPLPGRSLTFQP